MTDQERVTITLTREQAGKLARLLRDEEMAHARSCMDCETCENCGNPAGDTRGCEGCAEFENDAVHYGCILSADERDAIAEQLRERSVGE